MPLSFAMIMASVSKNLLFTTAIKLRYHIFTIPRVERNGCLSCANDREYCSSFPVKYVPNKSSILEKAELAALPGKPLEELKKHTIPDSNVPRVKSFSDSRGRFLDFEAKNHDYMHVTNINNDNEEYPISLDDEIIEEPEKDSSKICLQSDQSLDVEKLAIELLASRAFTALEMRKRLQRKKIPLEIVDSVIMSFQKRGLINDCLYAETFARSRWSSLSWGPQRIKQELFRKGVSEVDAESAIKAVFENDDASEAQDSGLALSQLSIDQLYIQASKQWLRSHAVPRETRKSRVVRWLQYRGFSWTVIKFVLKKLESAHPS